MGIYDWILLILIALCAADCVQEIRQKRVWRAVLTGLLLVLLLYLARMIFVYWYRKMFGP
jgi:hypothetical protein